MNKSDDINERKDLSRTTIEEAYKVFELKRGLLFDNLHITIM